MMSVEPPPQGRTLLAAMTFMAAIALPEQDVATVTLTLSAPPPIAVTVADVTPLIRVNFAVFDDNTSTIGSGSVDPTSNTKYWGCGLTGIPVVLSTRTAVKRD